MTSDPVSVHRRISTNDANEALIVAGEVYVCGAVVFNTNAAVRYLKLYNSALAVTETATPIMTLGIPGSAISPQPILFPPVKFPLGLAMRLVTGVADNDTGAPAAASAIVHVFYHG